MMNSSIRLIKPDRLSETFKNFDDHIDNHLGVFFYNIYNLLPHCYNIYIDNDGEVKTKDAIDYFHNIEIKLDNNIDTRYLIKSAHNKEDIKLICIADDDYVIVGDTFPFLIHVMVSDSQEHDSDVSFELYCDPNYLNEIISLLKPCFRPMDRKYSYAFGIATYNSNSIYTSHYDYSPKDISIENNYNDDFQKPYEKICEVIEKKNETGLVLMYGEPGTGKSSVIKNLISKYPETEFVFVDGSLLANVPNNLLVSYFIENVNTVFILEDCEKVLMSREEGYNPVINTLLNVTDGIIGDVLGIKLICTFNTSLSKIDKALLRKGRLSVKYEFKKLKANKVSKILGREVKEDMNLADIYNIDNENDFSKTEKKKVGFNN